MKRGNPDLFSRPAVSPAGKQEGADRYFCEENGVLPEQLGKAPLHEVTTFVGPERLPSWHRRLIASNYGVSQRRGAGLPLAYDVRSSSWRFG